MKNYGVPGMALAIVDQGQILSIQCVGYSDCLSKQLIEPDSIFQLASISKTLTAWGIMKLVDEHKIRLQDPINQHLSSYQLPSSPFDHKDVTIERILNHTSGLSISQYSGYPVFDRLLTPVDSLNGKNPLGERLTLLFRPGSCFYYSGGGYTLLQLLIEDKTKGSFEAYMNEAIFRPLKMTHTTCDYPLHHKHKICTAYSKTQHQLSPLFFTEQAAAGMYSSIADMAKFVQANLNIFSQIILKPETLISMFRWNNNEYALGYELEKINCQTILVFHRGANKGWRSGFYLLPDQLSGIVILTNSDNGSHLVDDVINDWIKWKTGQTWDSYKTIQKERLLFRIAGILIQTVLTSYLIILIKQLYLKQRSLRQLSFKNLMQVTIYFTLCFLWWLIFYSSLIYPGGWIVAAFLPASFDTFSISMIAGWIALAIGSMFTKSSPYALRRSESLLGVNDRKEGHIE